MNVDVIVASVNRCYVREVCNGSTRVSGPPTTSVWPPTVYTRLPSVGLKILLANTTHSTYCNCEVGHRREPVAGCACGAVRLGLEQSSVNVDATSGMHKIIVTLIRSSAAVFAY